MKICNQIDQELELMLARQKPLAMFYAYVEELPNEDLIPESSFEVHVATGLFVRDERIYEFRGDNPAATRLVKYVFFALKLEEWRISAMKLVVATSHRMGGWHEALERLEGALLGYSEEQIDNYCKRLFSKSAV